MGQQPAGRAARKKDYTLLIAVAVIIALGLLSFRLFRMAYEIDGPTRMVPGENGSFFVLVNDVIVHAAQDGSVLGMIDLASLGVREPVADFLVEPGGDIMVGSRESQLIRTYGRDGVLRHVHSRSPSPLRNGQRNFKFTRDPATGILYVADSDHHRIQIYGPDEQEIRSLSRPSGRELAPDPRIGSDEEGEGWSPEQDSPDRDFRFPNVLALDGDRLYATDTDNWRIVVFRLDGTFDRMIQLVRPGDEDVLPFPVRFTRLGDVLFVVKRGVGFVNGEVIARDLVTQEQRRIIDVDRMDPQDILAHGSELLVSDRNTMSILRVDTNGALLGTFGDAAFNKVLAKSRFRERAYRWLSKAALWAMGGVFVLLTFLAVKDSISRMRGGAETEAGSLEAVVQHDLGPAGSRRRTLLLTMVPGLGQFAAGRFARGVVFLLPLIGFVVFFAYSVAELLRGSWTALPLVMTTGLLTAGVWAAVIVDGKRLAGVAVASAQPLEPGSLFRLAAVPLVTALFGMIGQIAWDLAVNQANPGISIAIQRLMRAVIAGSGDRGGLAFTAMRPTNMFFSWGCAVAGLMLTTAWFLKEGREARARAAIAGLFVGMLAWIINTTLISSRTGGAFIEPVAQGVLVGLGVYAFFQRQGMPAAAILAATIGAWVGEMVSVFMPILPFGVLMRMPGTDARVLSVIVPAYCIHLGILIAIRRMVVPPAAVQRRKQAPAPDTSLE